MKKRNLTLALIALLATTASLTACGKVSKKDGVLITLNNGGELPQDINVDEIFNRYLTKSTGVSAYYNAICEVVIRASIEETDKIKNDAKQSVNEKKDLAKSNANSNGTSYDTELDNILKQEGVEDLDELRDKFVYDQLKEKANDDYFENKEKDGKFELLKEYINKKVPYHISHILIKTDSASANDGGYSGEISESEARELTGLVAALATGKTSFGSLAEKWSDDTGSAEKFGDVGIVTTDTNFVSEFKLGIYAYDLMFNAAGVNSTSKDADRARVGMSEDAVAYFENQKIFKIKYDDILAMQDYVDVTTDKNGHQVNEGKAKYYPRNVYFNQLFNSHKPALIISNKKEGAFKDATDVPELKGLLEDNEYALCTSTNKPIMVVRSGSGDSSSDGYQGIFFIVAEKSGITATTEDLVKYYDYKKSVTEYDNLFDQGELNYVNFHKAENTEYNKRADEIENAVQSFDQMLDASIFEYYYNAGNFKISDKITVEVPKYVNGKREGTETLKLEDAIMGYISNTREMYAFNNENTLNQAWDSYVDKLAYIDENRSEESTRLIPLVCATQFKDANDDGNTYFERGGVCYGRN